MSDKAFKQRVKYHQDSGCTPEEAVQRAQIRELYKKISRHSGLSLRLESDSPSQEEIRREVDKLKAMGLMTEIPNRQEIVSEAQVFALKRSDENQLQQVLGPLVTFNPSQPVFVPAPTQADGWKPAEVEPKVLVTFDPSLPVFIPTPTQAEAWLPARETEVESAPEEEASCVVILSDPEPAADWFRLIACGIGALICTVALIMFGAQAGGNTFEAKFWSCMIVIPGSILLALPFRWWLFSSWIHKLLGAALISIGYVTMHASIETTEKRTVLATAAGSTEVLQLEKRIADIEAQLSPTRLAISRLDPLQYRTMISRMQAEAKPMEKALAEARDALVLAQNQAITKASAGEAGNWGFVEWLRRLMLEPLNILCLHGFLESLPAAMKALRRHGIHFAQTAIQRGS